MNGVTTSEPRYRPRHPVAYLTVPGADPEAGDMGQPYSPLDWVHRCVLPRCRVSSPLRAQDNPERPAGWVITLPLGQDDLRGGRRLRRVMHHALGRARDLGALTVGWSGPWPSNPDFVLPDDLGFTTGEAFAAALCVMTVRRLLAHVPGGAPTALVGADSAVGRRVVPLLADLAATPVLLSGRCADTLHALRDRVGHGRAQVVDDPAELRVAGLVVVLEAPTLRAEHLGRDTIVLDTARPRATRPELLLDRPDVRVVDGGRIALPGIWRSGPHRSGATTRSACLAETLLLGLAGQRALTTPSAPHTGPVQQMLDLAARFSTLGFMPAAPQSFGAPVNLTRRFEAQTPRAATRPGLSGFPRAELTP